MSKFLQNKDDRQRRRQGYSNTSDFLPITEELKMEY